MRKSFYLFFFLLAIIISTFHPSLSLPAIDNAMIGQEKSRDCESQSHGFHGACVSDHNCALVCRDEGFSGGDCKGFRRRCFCTKRC